MSGLLASVRSAAEAGLALQAGADIIDGKDPADGALGALAPARLREIVTTIAGRRPVSATLGNLTADDPALAERLTATVASGVDLVKVGLFEPARLPQQLRALARLAPRHPMVAVWFAEQRLPACLIPRLAAAGLHGIMVDTANKHGPGLTGLWSAAQCRDLVTQARQHGLLCGLAGRLQAQDVVSLRRHEADYLGFRSALCGGQRTRTLDPAACRAVRQLLPGAAGGTAAVKLAPPPQRRRTAPAA